MRLIKLVRLPLAALAFAFPLMLISLILAWAYQETEMFAVFGLPLALAVVVAAPVLFSFKKTPPALYAQDGYLIVTLTWVILIVWGALPYYLYEAKIHFIDALFESASAFTTTGASTLADLDVLPRSLIFWRCISYWIGGMGIILLTVALMPLLGVGGFQLIKAETTGPDKEKITPKVTGTAKVLWIFYCIMTLILFLLYLAGGMDVFDAICHSFATVSAGSIATKNSSLTGYNSAYLTIVWAVFMFLAGVNFNIYYRLIRRNVKEVFFNSELRAYIILAVVISIIITVNIAPLYNSMSSAALDAVFQTISFLSTTGAVITDYTRWPALAQMLLFFLMFTGGCSGSTAGGIKLIRFVVLYKQTGNEFRRLLYPRGVFSVHLNHKVGRKDVVYGVTAFVFLYMMTAAFITLATAAAGFDIITSLTTSFSMLGNLGSGFGAISPGSSFSVFPAHLKLLYAVAMIAGRLEIWTVLVLFHREYWQS
ncbi:MAG: TrkH family potassium uptake protein [Spirochaetaceae bacterium]|jgi:trk system potassium uptake protein TrkH|nr:TrkH family potassium uptake protein [Spirochaetaceae bacterium]